MASVEDLLQVKVTTPFANNGLKSKVPLSKQPDGSVSYEEGFGTKYNDPIESGGDPIPGDKFNQLLNDITGDLTNTVKVVRKSITVTVGDRPTDHFSTIQQCCDFFKQYVSASARFSNIQVTVKLQSGYKWTSLYLHGCILNFMTITVEDDGWIELQPGEEYIINLYGCISPIMSGLKFRTSGSVNRRHNLVYAYGCSNVQMSGCKFIINDSYTNYSNGGSLFYVSQGSLLFVTSSEITVTSKVAKSGNAILINCLENSSIRMDNIILEYTDTQSSGDLRIVNSFINSAIAMDTNNSTTKNYRIKVNIPKMSCSGFSANHGGLVNVPGIKNVELTCKKGYMFHAYELGRLNADDVRTPKMIATESTSNIFRVDSGGQINARSYTRNSATSSLVADTNIAVNTTTASGIIFK